MIEVLDEAYKTELFDDAENLLRLESNLIKKLCEFEPTYRANTALERVIVMKNMLKPNDAAQFELLIRQALLVHDKLFFSMSCNAKTDP